MQRPCRTGSDALRLTFLVVCSMAVMGVAPVVPAGPDAPQERLDVAQASRTWSAPPVDVERLLAEDGAVRRKDIPFRVGFPMKTELTPGNSGTWEDRPDGGQVWRLDVRSDRALWLVVGFSEFRLPAGAELFVADAEQGTVLGPYTSADERPHGQLWFPPIEGDRVAIELRWPARLRGQTPRLRLGTVSHGYRPWGGFGDTRVATAEKSPAIGESGACNVDVACPEGDGWEDQARSVVRILSGGSAVCTGALINTTANDCTPYVLTASHCNLNPPSTTFQFGYQRTLCNGGLVETTHLLTGSTLVANYVDSDFTLLLLDQSPPDSFDAFFSGWNRSTIPATTSAGIHHPRGDVKKISHNYDPLIDGPGGGSGWGPDHWRVTHWEVGTTEASSSGSPLFDQNRLIVGQLHGGLASCDALLFDEYGKFNFSWTGGGTPASRLRDWLDPVQTGQTALAGIDYTYCLQPQPQLGYTGHEVDDSAGNGNGQAEPGETIALLVTLENTGSAVASQISGTLSSSTPGVAVVSAVADWPDLAVGQSAQSLAPFTIQLDPALECGTTLAFRVQIQAAEAPGAWSGAFSVGTGREIGTLVPFEDDMESGTVGWTPLTLIGANPWAQSSARSNSPSRSWFVRDIEGVTDSVLLLNVLPNLPPRAELSFAHWMSSEAGFDGGVLEYRLDGGTWNDAGPLIVTGGYNLAISSDWSSPLAGRMAWSGSLGTWRTVTVDLSSQAGHDVALRWRFATDQLVGTPEGWYVDDVAIRAPQFHCDPPQLLPPGEVCGDGEMFLIDDDPGGYRLDWSAPKSGGAVAEYLLYSRPMTTSTRVGFSCEGSLGVATSAVVGALPLNRVFVIVGRNAAGEGSYGTDSEGTARAPAVQVCP